MTVRLEDEGTGRPGDGRSDKARERQGERLTERAVLKPVCNGKRSSRRDEMSLEKCHMIFPVRSSLHRRWHRVIYNSIYQSLLLFLQKLENCVMALLSVIVPIFNEEDNIVPLVDRLNTVLEPILPDFEIIFIDDSSTDHSIFIIKQLARNDQRIKFLSFSRNFGQQAALSAGLDFATGKAVITMDADLQDPPELIPEMIKKWQNGVDLVLTKRRHRNDSIFKRMTAKMYYALLNRFSEYKFPGNIGDFRLMDKKVADELRNLKEKTRYLRGMIFWLGFNYTVIDYDRPNRKHGKSGFSFLKMVRLGMNGILNFSLLPLRIALVLGILVIFMGLFFLVYFAVDIYLHGVVYPLYKWLSVITFIFTGFLFILIWILGEYIGKIFNEVKNRPIYIIREKGNLEG
jgi:dolichol-phosphate mannosyltransferase